MAYIVPNTDIVLCRDVPLDSSYDHTVSFASDTAAWQYFYSKRYKVIPLNSYQRVMNGRLRIECTMEEAIHCNYMYFRNNNFENKFIYAFITGWYYINNITTEISYEIDVFQTFFSETRLLQTFVEREHSATDNIGDNLVPENLEVGDYLIGQYNEPDMESTVIVFFCTFNSETSDDPITPQSQFTFSPTSGYWVNRMYNGLRPIAFDNTYLGTQNMTNWLQQIPATYQNGIISACIMPKFILQHQNEPATDNIFQVNKSYPVVRSDGRAIQNNKLFTSPYNYLYITNYQGSSAVMPYEYFTSVGGTCDFALSGDLSPSPSVSLIPLDFKGAGICADEMISLNGFPMVSWNADAFKAWLAQNASGIAVNALSTAMPIIAGLGTGASAGLGALGTGGIAGSLGTGTALSTVVGGAAGAAVAAGAAGATGAAGALGALGSVALPIAGVATVASILAPALMHYSMPPQAKGNTNSQLLQRNNLLKFGVMNKHIRPEFATIIDDYFNMYGYATHKVKYPNVTGRPHWNYVKTVGNTVDALGVPDPFLKTMNAAFNKGITIWHNPDEVGYYSLDNRPV